MRTAKDILKLLEATQNRNGGFYKTVRDELRWMDYDIIPVFDLAAKAISKKFNVSDDQARELLDSSWGRQAGEEFADLHDKMGNDPSKKVVDAWAQKASWLGKALKTLGEGLNESEELEKLEKPLKDQLASIQKKYSDLIQKDELSDSEEKQRVQMRDQKAALQDKLKKVRDDYHAKHNKVRRTTPNGMMKKLYGGK